MVSELLGFAVGFDEVEGRSKEPKGPLLGEGSRVAEDDGDVRIADLHRSE